MPAKGTRKLPDRQKVEMLIAKEVKQQSTATNIQLAAMFDVKPNTVAKLNYDNLTDDQKNLYRKVKAELGEKALFGASLALEKGQELVRQAQSAKELAGVTAFGKFAHDVYRLETGQPTEIFRDQAAMLQSLVNYCKLHANGPRQLAAMVLFAEGCGIDESLRRAEAEKILLEANEPTKEFNR